MNFLEHAICNACVLSNDAGTGPNNRNVVFGTGSTTGRIAIVGESPTKFETSTKEPFSGGSSKIVTFLLKHIGLDRQDVWFTNALLCHYLESQKKKVIGATKSCRPRLLAELKALHDLHVVLVCGTTAVKAMLGDKKSIKDEMYNVHWSDELQAFLIPTYHPALCFKEPDAWDDLVWAFEKAKELLTKPKDRSVIAPPPIQVNVARSLEESKSFLKEIASISVPTWLSIDCESDNTEWHKTAPLAIGFGTYDKAIISCFMSRNRPPVVADQQNDFFIDDEWISLLRQVANNDNLRFVFHHGVFDTNLIRSVTGVRFRIDYDTLFSDYALDERGGSDEVEGLSRGMKIGSHRLKSSAKRYLGVPEWEADIKQYLKNKDSEYSHIPRRKLHAYLARDLVYTNRLRIAHTSLLEKEPLSRKGWDGPLELVNNLMIPAGNEIARVEFLGIRTDRDYLDTLDAEMAAKLDTLRFKMLQRVRELEGRDGPPELLKTKLGKVKKNQPLEFNPRSPRDRKKLIFDTLGVSLTQELRTSIKGKKIVSEWPTGKDTLLRIKDVDPIIGYMLEHDDLAKLHSTYVRGIIERLDGMNYIHGQFTLTVTKTGRASSRNPNLQNIKKGPYIKSIFVPDEGCTFVNCDYKQLEIRVAAALSNDPTLIAACSGDIHNDIARQIFQHLYTRTEDAEHINELIALCQEVSLLSAVYNDYKNKPSDFEDINVFKKKLRDYFRFSAKPIAFGVIYGREAFSLATGELHCTVSEAERYIRSFFGRFSRLKAWLDEQQKLVKEHNWIEAPTGRRRRFPFLTEEFINKILKQSINAPVQAYASDICLYAFTKLNPILREKDLGRVVLLVHDAMGFSIRTNRLKEAIPIIINVMENSTTHPKVKFPVDVEVGPNYGNLKPYSGE